MNLLKKNRDYILQHIDPETGYGLLYSPKHDECVFLNTLAATLWKIPYDNVNPSRESRLFAEISKMPDAEEYLQKVLSDMRERHLLLPSDEEIKITDNIPKKSNSEYPLGQIYLYITKDCNARCYHCYQPTEKSKNIPQKRRKNQVSKEAILSFVSQALPLGVQSAKITGGEPLLRADLIEIIEDLRKLKLNVSMETNGSLIDEQTADALARLDVRVSLSLDGGSAEIHDTLRGFRGSFERVIKALNLLSQRGCQPQIIMAISRRNLDEVERVLRIAAENKCRLVKLNPVNTLGFAEKLKKEDVLLSIDELLQLYRNRKELESKYEIFIFLEGPPVFSSIYEIVNGHTAICPFTNILGLLSDGSLSFCGIGNSYSELIFGRINDKNFDIQKLWNGNHGLLASVRHILSRKLGGVCQNCVFESSCKGSCRALAYGEYKDFSAPHPWCQEAFEQGLFPSYYLKPQEGR